MQLFSVDAKISFKKFKNVFLPTKSWKNHLKKLLTLAEISSFQKFFITAQTAKMADFMFQNMAYRATVYRTGVFVQSLKS